MDKSLLRKTAFLSLALMLIVVTSSYALKQYQTITIEASNIDNNNTHSQNDTAAPGNIITVDSNSNAANERTDNETAAGDDLEYDQDITKKLGENYLVVKKPEGTQLALKLEDLYINKSIKLTISGITQDNLNNDMITRIRGEEKFTGVPKYTEKVSYELDKDEGTTNKVITKDFGHDLCHGITITTKEVSTQKLYAAELLIELDTVYAYFVYEDDNYYYIDLKKPSEVYDKILVIDAGHGGKDAGALSKGEKYYEKNINLDILLQLKKLLDKEDIKVYYTRTADDKVFLRPRVELANAVDCDYFISIHCNANEVTSPNGTEILCYNNKFKGVAAKDLANLFSEEIAKKIALEPRGIVEKHYDDIFIMDKSIVPMILIEVGYLTNNSDMNYLSQEENRMEVARGIYNGIMRAYKELPVTESGQ
jgi:N-acetylmuramoyl-L-alanine amidase